MPNQPHQLSKNNLQVVKLLNVFIPVNFFNKIKVLREKHLRIYNFMDKEFKNLPEFLKGNLFTENVSSVHFSFAKEGLLVLQKKGNQLEVFAEDMSYSIKKNIENFYSFKNDKEFILFFIFFYCLNNHITFSLLNDDLFFNFILIPDFLEKNHNTFVLDLYKKLF